jgi:hypothetical protein
VGSGLELSYLLLRLHDDRGLLRGVKETMQIPPTPENILAAHLTLYARLQAERAETTKATVEP